MEKEVRMKRMKYLLFIIFWSIIISCSSGDDVQIYTGVVEGTAIQIPAMTGGQIIELLIDTGQEVEQGQIIAMVDTLELSYQRDNLSGMLQEIASQQQSAEANSARAQKELRYVQEKYQRFDDLRKTESVSQQLVDDLKNQLQNAESAYQIACKQSESLAARQSQIMAQLKSISKKIKDARIPSPLAGIITNKYYEKGEAIPPLSPIAEVINLDEVWVKIYLSEKMLPRIKPGQEAKVKIDGTEQTLSGKISWINTKAEFTPKTILTPETRTSLVYATRVLIQNPDHILKHGMPVEIHL
jgi:HlyD family secretion protein